MNKLEQLELELNEARAKLAAYEVTDIAIKKIVKTAVGEAAPDNLTNIEYVQYLRDYLENIIDLMPGHVYWLDKNNVYLGCNGLHAKNAGLASRKDIVGKTNYDLPWKNVAEELHELNLKVLDTGEKHITEEPAMIADGFRIFLSEKVPLRDHQDKIVGILGVSFDITDRKKMEKERLDLALKASRMGTWVWDFQDNSFMHHYMYEEEPYTFSDTYEAAIAQIYPADQEPVRQAMLQALEQDISLDIEYRLLWPDKSIRDIAVRGKVISNTEGKAISMIGISWDITARKKQEKTLRQQQSQLAEVAHLNLMGEIASTLSHELNQPLAAITNYTQGCIRRLTTGNYRAEDLLNALQQASSQATRAGEIIHRMKQFIRKGKLYYETANIHDIIKETISMIQYEFITHPIPIQLKLSETTPTLQLDKIQIGQVILNLLRNAIQAMQNAKIDNPTIMICTLHTGETDSLYIDVIDNGPGFPPEISAQLFTPYFTTKKHGMGMGLAICRSIIEAHGGNFTAQNHASGGAWFRLSLPMRTSRSF